MMKQAKLKFPVRLFALICGLLLSVGAFAQNISVNGNIKDVNGEPIIGATVRVDGTTTGAISDLDGNFTLEAPKGSTLSVSYVGYLTQKVAASSNVVVTLKEDTQALNEVVVIGYGTAKKEDLTGSVTAIKPDEMNHGLQTNAQDMIQGKIAGVNVVSNDGAPGGGATIRIRGGSSLNASNDPLIVIDGLAMDSYGVQGLSNPLSMVNPNDIESFTVLKDASATAIYGSRASNGVIIITTKKGHAGMKPRVSYNGNLSFAVKKKTLDVMDGPEYMNFIKNLYGEDSEAYNALGYYDADGNHKYADTNWQNQIYRLAVSTDHNVTVTGGLKNMPYRVSLGVTRNEGILKTSLFKRYTASFNLSPSFFTGHLKFNINGKGMLAKNRYPDTGAIGAALYMDPTKPVVSDGSIYQKYFRGYGQWYSAASFDGDPNYQYTQNRNATSNPVATLALNNNHAISRSAIGNIEADYAIHGFEDLHLHMNAGVDYSNGSQDQYVEPGSTYYSNGIFGNYYGYTGWNYKRTYNLQLSLYAQYSHDFGKNHHFDIMAGHEFQKYNQKTDYNYFGTYPETNTLHAGEKFNEPTGITLYRSENKLESWFGRLNYTLLNRYMLTFTMRADGSSRFNWIKSQGKDRQWGYFPSAALAWRISEEPFMKDIKAINDLKLRLGWGRTGQQDGIGDYTYIPTYTPNLDHAYYPVSGNGVTYRPDAYNPNLTWEKTTTYNAGIDLSLLNNRMTFNVDWYYRKTKDLINSVYVSAGTNFSNVVTSNIGSLHNTGVEFQTTVRPIVTKDWTWEINYNFTYNKNKIDDLIGGSDDYYVETGGISAGTGGNIQAHTVGHSAYSFLVYQQVYDANGKPVPNTYVDRNGNGTIDSGDRYYYYKKDPDVTMGLGSKLQYKNWDFSFSMRASLGNYVYNDNLAGGINCGTGAVYTLNYLGNRQLAGVALGFTNPLTEQYFSDLFVENASFLKMDNITLGYSFNKFLGANITGRAYATVQNVFTITNYSGIDPEVQSGIDNNLYPRPITTIIGLSLNF